MPEGISPQLSDLISKLLVADPEKRLGGGKDDAREILNHEWFEGIDWKRIYYKQTKPPFKPKLSSPFDPRYIHPSFLKINIKDSPDSKGGSTEGKWLNFSYDRNNN
jgi:serine/threonine protein kinase